MRTTKLLIAIAIALGTTAASAAPGKYNAAPSGNDAATATTGQKWTTAGNRELQQENARTALDHQGFPQFNN
jgi:hypothetical protein